MMPNTNDFFKQKTNPIGGYRGVGDGGGCLTYLGRNVGAWRRPLVERVRLTALGAQFNGLDVLLFEVRRQRNFLTFNPSLS